MRKGVNGGMVMLLKGIISLYRKVSALYPSGCRYVPSCSEYALIALERHGIRGIPIIVRRLVRCGPWVVRGTPDPVP